MPAADIGDNPYKQLAKRFLITFFLGIVIYRFGVVVTVPDVDAKVLRAAIVGTPGEDVGLLQGVLKMANMFNGGALMNGSLFGLGIMPYISASIIMQLLAYSIPTLKALQKEGEVGRRKIQQYTRYLTLAICLVQSIFAALALLNFEVTVGGISKSLVPADVDPTMFVLQSMMVITTGSMILLWLAECITKFGVGNGVSVVIMISILAAFPPAIKQMGQGVSADGQLPMYLGLLALFLVIIAAMVYVTMARRNINLEQQRRIQGGRQYGGGQTKIPLMLNHAGVIPVIFGQPIIILLGVLFAKISLAGLLEFNSPGYRYIFAGLIIFFTYFYISITVDLNEWANNFKQSGFFIRGVKPGKNTVDYLKFRLVRLTFVGSLSLAIITILPTILGTFLGLSNQVAETILGGIGLLIVVGVSLDVIQKVSAFLLAHQYQGLMAKRASGSDGGGGGGGKATTGKLAPGGKRF